MIVEEAAEKISEALGGDTTRHGWRCLCPAHDDHEPSLDIAIKNETLLLKCRAGCLQDDIITALRSLDLWPKNPERVGPIVCDENRVASYRYLDPHSGEILAYKDRYESNAGDRYRKTFQWRQPDGSDGLPDGTDRLFPYGAEHLVKRPDATVLLVEGEKVANTLALVLDDEFAVISLPGGSDSSWTEQGLELVRGRRVIILPDEDDPGYKLLGRCLGALNGVADASWLKLPGLQPKGDAADWFNAGHTVDEFRTAIQQSRAEAPREDEIPVPEGKLPHNLSAERVILGSILLIQNDAYEAAQLTVPDFYPPAHQIIFRAMSELYEAEKPLGTNTVRDYLSGRNVLTEAGGSAYLRRLEDAGKTHYADYLTEQAALVRKAAVQRRLITAGEKVTGIGWEGKLDPDDAVQAAYDEVINVATTHGSSAFADMPGLMGDVSATLERLALHDGEFTGIESGYRSLDMATSGLQKGDLVIVAARPSIGKTAFGINMVLHAAHMGAKVAVFSVEMGREQIGQRFLSLESDVDHHLIRTGKIPRELGTPIRQSIERLTQLGVFVDDISTTVLEMKAKAKRLQREQGLDLVMVDYIQLMNASAQAQKFGSVTAVTEISKGLKSLARELAVPVIALSQLSRATEGRTDKRPMMSDIRDSGAVEQDADLILFLYRDEYYHPLDSDHPTDAPGVAELELAKHRNGPVGKFWLRFEKDTMRFTTMQPGDFSVLDQEGVA